MKLAPALQIADGRMMWANQREAAFYWPIPLCLAVARVTFLRCVCLLTRSTAQHSSKSISVWTLVTASLRARCIQCLVNVNTNPCPKTAMENRAVVLENTELSTQHLQATAVNSLIVFQLHVGRIKRKSA